MAFALRLSPAFRYAVYATFAILFLSGAVWLVADGLKDGANGELWQVYFDLESKLPAMVQANAPNGDLLERYLFRAVRPDLAELNTAEAFDPDRRWGESKGLLSRLARRPGTAARTGAPATTQ